MVYEMVNMEDIEAQSHDVIWSVHFGQDWGIKPFNSKKNI